MASIRVCMLVRNDCRTDARVLKEAGSLARAGFQITVIAMNTYGPVERESRDSFQIVRVPVERGRTKLNKAFNLLPRTYWRMARAGAAVGAQVYHAHDSTAILPAWLAARQVRGARLLYDAHEIGFGSLRESLSIFSPPLALGNWLWGQANDWVIRHHADAFITVNDALAEVQARHYGISRPAVVMNCPPRFTPVPGSHELLARVIGVEPGTPIIICQGMLSRERHGSGLANLLRSAPLLQRGVVCVLGRGPQFEELKQLASGPACAGRAHVLPAVPPDDLLNYTAGAAIGVIPTEPYNAFLRFSSPNKLFEYMAAGIPTVTSDLPIIRHICEENTCGVLCDPTSPEGIAGPINRLLNDPVLYRQLSAGAQRAAELYNWEHQEQILLGVYRDLLDDSPGETAEAGR